MRAEQDLFMLEGVPDFRSKHGADSDSQTQ